MYRMQFLLWGVVTSFWLNFYNRDVALWIEAWSDVCTRIVPYSDAKLDISEMHRWRNLWDTILPLHYITWQQMYALTPLCSKFVSVLCVCHDTLWQHSAVWSVCSNSYFFFILWSWLHIATYCMLVNIIICWVLNQVIATKPRM